MDTPRLYKDPSPDEETDEYTTIIVASITLKNGRRIYARDYGHGGFPIRVRKTRS